MQEVLCEGWWEQDGLGRQPMTNLMLHFDTDRIVGSGTDVIGQFSLEGTLKESSVTVMKHYLDAHTVDYLGSFDGEGTLQGVWSIHGVGGRWLIKVVGTNTTSIDIQDL